MAQTKPVSIPVLPGMHEEVSPHLAPVGTLVRAKNVRFPVGGEVQARPGTTALSVATDATYTPAALAGLDYLCECPGGFLFGTKGFGYRYDLEQRRAHASGSYGNAIPTGRLTTMAREEIQLAVGTGAPWPLSQAYMAGYVACLYSVGNGQGSQGPATDGYLCEVYTADGTPVTGTHQFGVGTASAGWVVADDLTGCFVLFKQDGTAISVATLTPSASGVLFSGFTAIVTLQSATSYWAPCTWPGIGWALAFQSTAVQVALIKGHGTSVYAAPVGQAVTGIQPVSLFADETHLWLGWVEVNGADCIAMARPYDTAVAPTAAAATLYTHLGPASLTLTPPLMCSASVAIGGVFVVVGQCSGPGLAGNKICAMYLATDGDTSIPSSGGDVIGAFPISAPFNAGMIWVRNDMGGICSTRGLLLDYQNARAGAAVADLGCVNPKVALVTEQFPGLEGTGYYGGLWRHHLCPPVAIGDTNEWVCGLPRIVRVESHGGGAAGLALADWIRFSTEATRPALPFGSSALIAGDLVIAEHPWGTRIQSTSTDTKSNQAVGCDVGFYTQPQGSAAASNTGPGQLSVSASYQYRLVIERIDSAGNRFRSAPSPVIAMTTGVADDTGTITAAFPSATLRSYAKEGSLFDAPQPSRCVMHVYRTVANAASTGATFYRATPPQGAPVIANGAATYVDHLSDANLAKREIIYTQGGVLNNDHPSSAAFLALSEDRVWLGGLFETNQLQSSKILVPGEGPQFSDSPAYRVVLPAPNTGVACQDGAVIAFTETGIYGVQGQGPTDQGQGAWDTPRVVTRSTGCIGGPTLETSAGIFFQSARGLEILPRGLGEPQFIGMPVQTTLGDNRVTSSAVITVGDTHTARFCIGTPEVLVFDLDTGAWSVDEYPANVVAICGTEQGAVVALESITAGGFGFYLEEADAVRDAVGDVPAEIACELEWASVHPFTIAGWGRINCAVGMFDELDSGYRGDCSIQLTVGGNPASVDSATFDMTAMSAPDFRKLTPSRMDGTYAQLSISTTAGGWRFMGWTLDMDDHGGSRRMAAGEQA